MINQATIDQIYKRLREKAEQAYLGGQLYNSAKLVMETARQDGLANGTITGKNADLRAASAAEVLASEQSLVDTNRQAFEEAKHDLAIARIWEDWLKMSVRLEELHERH